MPHSPARALVAIGRAVRDRVRKAMATGDAGLARPAAQGATDLQYGVDRLSEEDLAEEVARAFHGLGSVRLLAEGLDPAGVQVGPGTPHFRLVIDPIDGTRGLMHDKRSAFFLAGLAPESAAPRLSDLRCSAMVEIPTTRSLLSDVLWAERGKGASGHTEELLTGRLDLLRVRPSEATDLRHGFGTVVRFFGGAAGRLGKLNDELVRRLYPGDAEAQQDIFEDQYISNGGQMHALATGRDRFVADLRPLFTTTEGARLRTSHPYDVLGALVATEAGAVITDAGGDPLDPPLDLRAEVSWVGYANATLRERVEPHLHAALAAARA